MCRIARDHHHRLGIDRPADEVAAAEQGAVPRRDLADSQREHRLARRSGRHQPRDLVVGPVSGDEVGGTEDRLAEVA